MPPGGECLAALSNRLLTARARRSRVPSRTAGSSVGAEVDRGGVALGAGDGFADEVVEADVLALLGRLVAAGELDQVRDEHPQLSRLLLDVGEQPGTLVGRQGLGLGEDLDVGAQGRDRGAELVRGVRDQLPLGGDAPLQRVEHRVEVLGELADLVVGLDLDPATEVLGGGDVAGRVGHVHDRGDDVARDEPAQRHRERDPAEDHEQEDEPRAEPARSRRAPRSARTAPRSPRRPARSARACASRSRPRRRRTARRPPRRRRGHGPRPGSRPARCRGRPRRRRRR